MSVSVRLARGSEPLWARPIEGDLFALVNVPFFAFGLNLADVVHAPLIDGVRAVRAVVKPSGHRTLRVVFDPTHAGERAREHVDALRAFTGIIERASDRMIAVDVPADADFDGLLRLLLRWETEGVLVFETCEARRAGSFDDAPHPDADAA